MTVEYIRKIQKNSNFKYKSEDDLDDNFKALKQEYKLEFFDDCSKLSLIYTIDNYNDGNQLEPNKTFGLTYEWDF